MSQYPPYETCNLGYAHVLPEFKDVGPGRDDFGKWISVEDRLPPGGTLEDSPSVLITDGEFVGIGWYEAEYFADDPNDPVQYSSDVWNTENSIMQHKGWPQVTHWMKLPEPPK